MATPLTSAERAERLRRAVARARGAVAQAHAVLDAAEAVLHALEVMLTAEIPDTPGLRRALDALMASRRTCEGAMNFALEEADRVLDVFGVSTRLVR
jgi:hypothetical protein